LVELAFGLSFASNCAVTKRHLDDMRQLVFDTPRQDHEDDTFSEH